MLAEYAAKSLELRLMVKLISAAERSALVSQSSCVGPSSTGWENEIQVWV